ncbi:MAG: PH domain-containing protein, partial [Halalkalicoccus sp.]|nr:PH domain-containing protein [Halalkalicoccus sp.]
MTRLHPLSIPYRVAQAVLGYVPLVFFAAIASGPAFGGIGIALAALAILVGFVAAVAWQVAYFRRFEYETTPDTFDIRSGVVSRRNREIPYRRVQNVDISRNVVQRALEIAELRIETAGGGETEAILRYVGYEEAKRLQNELR